MNSRLLLRSACAIVLLGTFCGLVASASAQPVDYTNHRIVRVYPQSWDQIEKINALRALLLSEAENLRQVDYVVAPEAMPDLEAIGVQYTVLHDDVQRLIDEERARLEARGPADPRDSAWFQDYKDLAAVNAKLNAMVADRPDLVSLFDVGTTLEGRHIYGVRITGPGADKPAVQFNGCHHAREWISVMVPMWIADRLVYEYDANSTIQSIVDRVEFFIIPVVNLDGFVYSWTPNNRLWRKNRRLNAGGCYGVDDNRNYAAGWGGGGSSSNPCSDTYRGTAAFSEPETAAMRDFAIARPQIVAVQSYHSYSQLFMSPFGYTSSLPPDNATFLEVDAASAQAIAAVHGVSYGYGPIYSTIYQASGGDTDWYYAAEGIYSFTTELRDTGAYGFELPAGQIIPTCEESFAAAMYLAEWASSPVKFAFPGGAPTRLDPNTPANVSVIITVVGGTLDSSSPRLWTRVGESGTFAEHTLTAGGGSTFTAVLPATPCGRELQYYFTAATTAGITGHSPSDAPGTPYSATAAPLTTVFDQPMTTNPGWTTQGQWAFGQPTGGGSHNLDPSSGYTGTNVYGYNLSGDYANSIPAYYLTTPVIDCAGRFGVKLDFYRWLGVESNSDYDKATIEATNDGSNWTAVWRAKDTGAVVSDSSWQHVSYDLSATADNQPNVRIRWGMGPTDGYLTYPGWNIDDVKVYGSALVPCVGVGFGPGDLTQDGVVDGADIPLFVETSLNPGAATNSELCCADLNGDCAVDLSDVTPLVNLLLAP